MPTYTLATSPFGNFAVQVSSPDAAEIESFYLIPIGTLEEVPVRKDGYLDQTALEAEGKRQADEAGSVVPNFMTPRPAFIVNRSAYTAPMYVGARQRHYEPEPVTFFRTPTFDASLTESAERKMVAWWDSVRDSVITPEFLAADRLERAQYDTDRAKTKTKQAREALEEAIKHEEETERALAEARAALEAL